MHPNDGRVVSNFILQALRQEDITVFGDGSQSRSFCFVDDLVEGMIRMMGAADDFTGPINIGNPNEFSILELAEKVISLTGSKSKIIYRPLPEDDQNGQVDPGETDPNQAESKGLPWLMLLLFGQ